MLGIRSRYGGLLLLDDDTHQFLSVKFMPGAYYLLCLSPQLTSFQENSGSELSHLQRAYCHQVAKSDLETRPIRSQSRALPIKSQFPRFGLFSHKAHVHLSSFLKKAKPPNCVVSFI